ncbi:PilZ domain-containing protein, partial [Aliivibrio sifiae]
LCIQHIDIDSISHLKRLIELNVGNSDMLLRQLSELTTLT